DRGNNCILVAGRNMIRDRNSRQRFWQFAPGRRGHSDQGGHLTMRAEQRLDAFSRLGIGGAFAFENLRLKCRIGSAQNRLENTLDAVLINGHWRSSSTNHLIVEAGRETVQAQAREGEPAAISAQVVAFESSSPSASACTGLAEDPGFEYG